LGDTQVEIADTAHELEFLFRDKAPRAPAQPFVSNSCEKNPGEGNVSRKMNEDGNVDLLFGVLRRICQYSREHPSFNTVDTFDHYTIFVGVQEFFIRQKYSLDAMHELALTMGHEICTMTLDRELGVPL
jgi:hypothetical protein